MASRCASSYPIDNKASAIRTRIFALFAMAAALLLFAISSAPIAKADQDDNYKRVQGIDVYFGVLPAAMVRGHPKSHAEGTMHGGLPQGAHEYHILVATFDDATGNRIENAQVTATISPLGHVGQWSLALEPMTIAGIVTYGNFIKLPGNDRYTIRIDIRVPGRKSPVAVDFTFQHEQ